MTDERRYDDIDPQLRPTAERVADALRAEIPPEVARRHEALLRERAGGGSDVVRPLRRRSPRRTLVTLAAAAVLVLALPLVAVASDDAVPGDLLYGVDRAVERLELAVASGPADEVGVLLDQAAERLGELEALEERGRLEAVDALLGDLRDAEDRALETAGADEGLVGTTLTAIELHTQRLQDVRNRLAASGGASAQALDALDRAIQAGRASTGAEERGRPDEPGAPANERSPQDRPEEAPVPPGPPDGTSGQPDDPGAPHDGAPAGAKQAPDNPPNGPDGAPDGAPNESTNGEGNPGGPEVGGQQAEEQGNHDGFDPAADGHGPPAGPGRG